MPPLPEALAHFLLPEDGDRPLKRERTRRQLLQAAVQVISARGLADTGIQEIARVAGMAPGTVYNHFRTREEIFEALAVALSTTLNERVVQSYQGITDGAQRMSIGMRRFLWLGETSPPWALLLIQLSMAFPQVIALIKPYSLGDLRLAQSQGRFRVADEEAAIDLVFGTCQQAIARIAQGEVPEPAAYARELLQMVLVALGMAPADAAEVMARPLPPFVVAAPAAPARAGRRPARPRAAS
ncbi:TetR/AcrR family transcriptional regulator [Pseudorhodoferax sp.]|uniref:TetR/AcrR family transcriptional regulator n=1 Tax=Pseudorhodoferax sp. TaxID=1993553 RepID=UPI002DD69E7D|nr:helix-turn-helix domain-containing protein [Pseudorhodoferax sp.]